MLINKDNVYIQIILLKLILLKLSVNLSKYNDIFENYIIQNNNTIYINAFKYIGNTKKLTRNNKLNICG